MIEIDAYAHEYCELAAFRDSLLHLAAKNCNSRIVRFLLESGWSLDSHDLNSDGLSPIGACVMGTSPNYGVCITAATVCATLDVLLSDVEDAVPVMHNSGLLQVYDVNDSDDADDARSRDDVLMPSVAHARIHTCLCAVVRAHSRLPQYMLNTTEYAACIVHDNSPTAALSAR